MSPEGSFLKKSRCELAPRRSWCLINSGTSANFAPAAGANFLYIGAKIRLKKLPSGLRTKLIVTFVFSNKCSIYFVCSYILEQLIFLFQNRDRSHLRVVVGVPAAHIVTLAVQVHEAGVELVPRHRDQTVQQIQELRRPWVDFMNQLRP
jgi:hypothetical protein